MFINNEDSLSCNTSFSNASYFSLLMNSLAFGMRCMRRMENILYFTHMLFITITESVFPFIIFFMRVFPQCKELFDNAVLCKCIICLSNWTINDPRIKRKLDTNNWIIWDSKRITFFVRWYPQTKMEYQSSLQTFWYL